MNDLIKAMIEEHLNYVRTSFWLDSFEDYNNRGWLITLSYYTEAGSYFLADLAHIVNSFERLFPSVHIDSIDEDEVVLFVENFNHGTN